MEEKKKDEKGKSRKMQKIIQIVWISLNSIDHNGISANPEASDASISKQNIRNVFFV